MLNHSLFSRYYPQKPTSQSEAFFFFAYNRFTRTLQRRNSLINSNHEVLFVDPLRRWLRRSNSVTVCTTINFNGRVPNPVSSCSNRHSAVHKVQELPRDLSFQMRQAAPVADASQNATLASAVLTAISSAIQAADIPEAAAVGNYLQQLAQTISQSPTTR